MLFLDKAPRKKELKKAQRNRVRLLSEVESTSKKGKVKYSVGIDIGTGFASGSVFDGSKIEVIESPHDGPQTPTAAYYEKPTKTWHVGSEAEMRSFDDPSGLATQVKRNLYERPTEKVYCEGQFSAVEVTAEIVRHMVKLLLARRPELADYPQFGGGKKSAEELVITFTIPGCYSEMQKKHFEDAIKLAGIHEIDGFVAEPVAAARHASQLSLVHLSDGDRIGVGDIGAGTSDFVVMKYDRGVFHQETAAGGHAYLAGHDFTNAIAEAIAKQLGVAWDGVFDQGGFNLCKASEDQRANLHAIWKAAEEAKKKLSVLADVKVAVMLPDGGRKMFGINRQTAAKLWKPLLTDYRKSVSEFGGTIKGGIKSVDHILLVGGSASLTGLREQTAKALGCPVDKIILGAASENAISNGAAQMGFFQDAADKALESGLGFVVRERETGADLNLLFLEPGTIIPVDGFYFEWSGFYLTPQANGAGPGKLLCQPFACRTGVRPKATPDKHTLLKDSEVLRFEDIEASVKGWPEGEQEVTLGLTIDPNARPSLIVGCKGRPDIEQLSISLELAGSKKVAGGEMVTMDIMLILDFSGSIAGPKQRELTTAAEGFAKAAIERGSRVGVCVFPVLRAGETRESARVVCQPTRNVKELARSMKLTCGGSTPMDAGIAVAAQAIDRNANKNETAAVGVLFSDGAPNDREATLKAANEFKKKHRLFTVAIGEDAVKPFLRDLASSPADFFTAKRPEDILGAFNSVAERLFSTSRRAAAQKANPSASNGQGRPSDGTKGADASSASDPLDVDEDSWDAVVGDDEMEVAS